MTSSPIINFVTGTMVALGLFITLLLLMELLMAVSDNASADVPVRKARLGEQDRSVSGSQHIPGGRHDHQFDYLMYEITASQTDVDDNTPAPITTAADTPCTNVARVPEHAARENASRSGGL